MRRPETPISAVTVETFRIPTATPESDGTAAWDSTTLVVVHVSAGGQVGLGYTYADTATAAVVRDVLTDAVCGGSALDIPAAWQAMVRAIRNHGRPGVVSMAMAAVDVALWDLKAKLLDLPLVELLGSVRAAVPIYGSGGFTSYDRRQLQDQLAGWVADGIRRVKMKVGRDPAADPARVASARQAIGERADLFVDANGAYDRKQALAMAGRFAAAGVTWFEEPVSSDDLAGLHLIRDQGPPGMAIAAGEYGYDSAYFRRMLAAGAVDVLQADASRCAGITGFLVAGALCEAFNLPLSSHCAPALHLPVAAAVPALRHMEYFFDHVRIEAAVFDGTVRPIDGLLRPDRTRPGLGLEFRRADAARLAA